MITALNKGGDRGSALVRVSAVAFEETSSSDGAFSTELRTNGVDRHLILLGIFSSTVLLRLAPSWPVCQAHFTDVGLVARFATVRVRTKFCSAVTPALVHASSYKYFLALEKIALEKLQGSARHPRNPFSACDRGMPTGVQKSCAWAGVQALA